MADDIIKIGKDWFDARGWTPFQFQIQSWEAYLNGKSGLVNAPTGSGKTYSLMIPTLLEFIRDNPHYKSKKNNGLQVIWITPIRALSKEIELSGVIVLKCIVFCLLEILEWSFYNDR